MKKKSTPLISLVAAMSQNRVIGYRNQIPWHLPADLKHFKSITTGHPIIMGRKTYDSIGKALPNRINIIISKQDRQIEGTIVVNSVKSALKIAESDSTQEIFIVGGEEIYKQFLPQADIIYLTLIHETFPGDTFFPELDKMEWREVEHITHEADDANPYRYSFLKLERKR